MIPVTVPNNIELHFINVILYLLFFVNLCIWIFQVHKRLLLVLVVNIFLLWWMISPRQHGLTSCLTKLLPSNLLKYFLPMSKLSFGLSLKMSKKDKCTEFLNSQCQQFFLHRGVNHQHTYPHTHNKMGGWLSNISICYKPLEQFFFVLLFLVNSGENPSCMPHILLTNCHMLFLVGNLLLRFCTIKHQIIL